ncbi:MAG: hypothetical protein PT977_07605 [Acidobacteriota bacterium]|nr:hypothetical protein [Acidobacteriota bacterium]
MTFVALRKCPSCGGELDAWAGVAWMSCRDCPRAWDLFSGPPEKIVTYRPAEEDSANRPEARLPLFLFGTRSGAEEAVVWIPAYRAAGARSDSDVASVLTERKHRPALVEAPLGCALARGPREALALFDALHPSDEDGTLAWQVLVSLPVRLAGGSLHEPVSNLWLDVPGIRPRVLART